MSIVEALKKSKETGESFTRTSGGGWISWDADWTYKLSGEDLIADDWEPAVELISRITGGKWCLAETNQ